MQLVVAIPLPKNVLKKLENIYDALTKIDVNLVPINQTHLTLAYLGSQDPDIVVSKLKKIKKQEIEIQIQGFGFLPNAKKPEVIVLKTQKNQEINNLENQVLTNLNSSKVFDPYVKIGEINKATITKITDILQNYEKISFKTDTFKIIGIKNTKFGKIYTTLETF